MLRRKFGVRTAIATFALGLALVLPAQAGEAKPPADGGFRAAGPKSAGSIAKKRPQLPRLLGAIGALAADDNIPGVAIPATPITGTVDEFADPDDVFSIYLAAGQRITASVVGPAGTDFDLGLFAPNSTDVMSDEPVAFAADTSYPDAFTYIAPQSGTYYLDVFAFTGAGSYAITYSAPAPAPDDNVPGVWIPASPFTNGLDDFADLNDVYRVALAAGQEFRVTLNGAAASDFDLFLFGPGSSNIYTDVPVASAERMSYPDVLIYTVPTSGTYYLDVSVYEGGGSYSISYVDPVPPTRPTVSSSTHPVQGTWYRNNDPVFSWTASDRGGSGIRGYAAVLDRSSTTVPNVVNNLTKSRSFTNVGEGAWWFHVRARDRAGNWGQTAHYKIWVDTRGPVTTVTAPVSSSDQTATLTFRVRWSATDPLPQSGIAFYGVQIKDGAGGTWMRWQIGTSQTSTKLGIQGRTYYFRARARDRAGNFGPWSPVKATMVPYDDALASPTVVFGAGWSLISSPDRYRFGARSTRRLGATFRQTFWGRAATLIVTKAGNYGEADIYIDGAYLKTVDFRVAGKQVRSKIPIIAWPTPGVHIIAVRNKATSARPTIELDGLAVLK